MIIVRNCFVSKPGCASKLATVFREAAEAAGMKNYRVLTDLTGEFNRVVLEYEAASLTEVDARMREYQSNSILRDKMKGYTDLWMTGHRELMQVAGS
jgi:hypothetical protein